MDGEVEKRREEISFAKEIKKGKGKRQLKEREGEREIESSEGGRNVSTPFDDDKVVIITRLSNRADPPPSSARDSVPAASKINFSAAANGVSCPRIHLARPIIHETLRCANTHNNQLALLFLPFLLHLANKPISRIYLRKDELVLSLDT